MRILLIEDDQRLQDSLTSHLREAGFAVDASADGIEGLYLGEEFPVDLAIIDLGLPEMSGLEVIAKLRSRGRDFPILVLTARSEWQDKVAGLEAGADDYLTKPFHIEELMARVNALIRRAGGHAQPRIQLGPVTVDLSSVGLTGGTVLYDALGGANVTVQAGGSATFTIPPSGAVILAP